MLWVGHLQDYKKEITKQLIITVQNSKYNLNINPTENLKSKTRIYASAPLRDLGLQGT